MSEEGDAQEEGPMVPRKDNHEESQQENWMSLENDPDSKLHGTGEADSCPQRTIEESCNPTTAPAAEFKEQQSSSSPHEEEEEERVEAAIGSNTNEVASTFPQRVRHV